jgi:hypothetical protein
MTTRATLALSLAAMTLVACGDNKNKIPSSPEGRIDAIAARLPAASEASLYLADYSAFKESSKQLEDTLGPAAADFKSGQEELKTKFGIDLSNPESLKEAAGISPKGGLGIGLSDNRATLMVFVEDQAKFDEWMKTKIAKEIEIEGEPTSEKVGEAEVKILGSDAKKQIAWTHYGKLAIVASPQLEEGAGGEASIAKYVAGLTTTEKANSTADSAAFKQFKAEFGGKYMLAGFANLESIKKSSFYAKAKKDMENEPGGKESLAQFEKYGRSLGFGTTSEGRNSKIKLFVGGTDELNTIYKGIGSDIADNPFVGFATEKTIAALRISVNFTAAWAAFKKLAPKEQVAEIDAALKQGGQASGLDIEKDVLGQLTGNIGVFFYGVDLAGAMAAMENPAKGASAVEIALGVQFKSAEALKKLTDTLIAKVGPMLSGPFADVEGVKGAQSVSLPENAGHIVTYEGTIAISTSAIPAKRLAQLLANTAEDKKITTTLGKPLATKKPFGGLFVSASSLAKALGPMATANPEAKKFFDTVDEIALSFEGSDNGVSTVVEFQIKEASK